MNAIRQKLMGMKQKRKLRNKDDEENSSAELCDKALEDSDQSGDPLYEPNSSDADEADVPHENKNKRPRKNDAEKLNKVDLEGRKMMEFLRKTLR